MKPVRMLLVNPFSLPDDARYLLRPTPTGSREERLMNHASLAHLLADVDWDLHAGAPSTHGDWPCERREELAQVGVNRLAVVREACASGRWDAIVLLGGSDPGYLEAREIGVAHGVVVTSCTHAQMLTAAALGFRFGVIEITQILAQQIVKQARDYALLDRCVSVRQINYPMRRPGRLDVLSIHEEKQRFERGEASEMLDAAFEQARLAVEQDGADVLMIGCSAAYWMQPGLQQRLHAAGLKVPVLEGYRCAIEQARSLVRMGLNASPLAFPDGKLARAPHRIW